MLYRLSLVTVPSYWADELPPALYQALKAIGAPVLTADAVVDEEETAGVILMFHRSQSRVVRTPERSLPRALEEVARHIRTRVSHHLQQFIHRRLMAAASRRAAAKSGSCPIISGNAGALLPAMIARANPSNTTGFIAVSLAAARTSARAPASPLLKCSDMLQWRLPANSASARALLILLKERRGQPGER